MNPEIRATIIESFGLHATRSRDSLLEEISKRLNISTVEVVKQLGLMVDAGHIEDIGGSYRITLDGLKANAPLRERAMDYLRQHWIAIVALLFSLIALFKN